jgi:hypothetical protein
MSELDWFLLAVVLMLVQLLTIIQWWRQGEAAEKA